MKKRKRFQSSQDKNVWLSPWKSELSSAAFLSFMGMIEIVNIRFFLLSDKKIFVVTIPRRSPFKVIDESYLDTMRKLFHFKKDDEEKVPESKAWQLWGTSFLKDLDAYKLLFFDSPEEKKFQYLIATEDEWLEFVARDVDIESLPLQPLVKVIEKYTKQDLATLTRK